MMGLNKPNSILDLTALGVGYAAAFYAGREQPWTLYHHGRVVQFCETAADGKTWIARQPQREVPLKGGSHE